MNEQTVDKIMDAIDKQIIRTLLYYDIFNYPLTGEEVFRFLGSRYSSESTILHSLQNLCGKKIIYKFKNLYGLKNNSSSAERRIKGNQEAEKYLMLAKKKSNFISKFPFVRAVLASGSLSKGYMDENSDLDFFIITEPSRLWIARTLLVLYKRLFLFNSHKYFCVNYFVDEKHLEIEEQNLFTATELATVIPLYGAKQYENLHRMNGWLKSYFPNYCPRSTKEVPTAKSSLTKSLLEKMLNTFFGKALEEYCKEKTLSRWRKQYEKNYSATDFKVAFKSKSYASKNHPRNFQRSVMEVYQEKLKSFGLTRGSSIGEESSISVHSSMNSNYTAI
jgi:hypothetical protein